MSTLGGGEGSREETLEHVFEYDFYGSEINLYVEFRNCKKNQCTLLEAVFLQLGHLLDFQKDINTL